MFTSDPGPPTRHRSPRTLSPLRCHLLRTTDTLASTTVETAVPLIVLRTTGSAAWSGASFAAEWILRLAAIPQAGVLVDRVGAGAVYRVAGALRAVFGASVVAALTVSPAAWWVAVLFGIASGVLCESTYIAAEQLGAGLAAAVPERPSRVQAVQVVIDESTRMAGPLLASLLLLVGTAAPIGAIAALSAAAVLLAWPIRLGAERGRQRKQETHHPLRDMADGARTVRDSPVLRRVTVLYSASNLLYALMIVATPPILIHRFGCSEAAIGGVWAAGFCLSVAGVAPARAALERYGPARTGAIAFTVLCLSGLAAGVSNTLLARLLCTVLVLGTLGAVQLLLRTVRNASTPSQAYGTVTAAVVLAALMPNAAAGLLVAAVPGHLSALIVIAALLAAAANTAALRGLTRTAVPKLESP
ncbi:MFS transporter [Catenulispora sp. NL8]|uniref:MFS transporter n=1 Tax=Catenulispora pinistramenti TaxID=2705254 RepID=A0ABS5KWX3_9ACTN|nr:MFS transporter [Catenulispora pinistramenti]MBS2550566.1 MFS transporter [Catenulispora pinistramenti]